MSREQMDNVARDVQQSAPRAVLLVTQLLAALAMHHHKPPVLHLASSWLAAVNSCQDVLITTGYRDSTGRSGAPCQCSCDLNALTTLPMQIYGVLKGKARSTALAHGVQWVDGKLGLIMAVHVQAVSCGSVSGCCCPTQRHSQAQYAEGLELRVHRLSAFCK